MGLLHLYDGAVVIQILVLALLLAHSLIYERKLMFRLKNLTCRVEELVGLYISIIMLCILVKEVPCKYGHQCLKTYCFPLD